MSAIEAIEALQCVEWYERTARIVNDDPEPLNLTDTEIIQWLDEYADGVTQVRATRTTPRVFIVECDMITTTRGRTLREAVCLAAAKLEEANS